MVIAPYRRVLVVAAHPDDIESWCAGTVRLFTRSGAAVSYVICTSGENGFGDEVRSLEERRELREAEQREAARRLDVADVAFLRYADGELSPDRHLRGDIVRAVRRLRPELVITFDPEYPYPPYIAHRDHRACGRVTLDALYPDARDRLYFTEQLTGLSLEPHKVAEAWLMASSAPDHYVDISETIEDKVWARLAHASQHTDPEALREGFRWRAQEIGKAAGLAYAEAFKRLHLPD